ncbi:MAG: preQ(1) synthase [Candidatus Accumulibacter sp.]|jgi:7-cyano-7-deazaguanine reductase|nr:preQ(1) synthase [Accumulibacter sp.]
MTSQPAKILETFPNPAPRRDYLIHLEIPEFTCLCPKTGQPDFAALSVDFIADQSCVELKSLKLYIWSFRDEGCFHEAVTNRVLDDLVKAAEPRFMRVTARFFVRGGIFTTVVAEHRKQGWQPEPRIELAELSLQPNPNTRG